MNGKRQQSRPRRGRLRRVERLAVALLIVGLLWRFVRYALDFPLFGDEAFVATSLLERNAVGLLQPLEYGQIAPLGFMWSELAVCRVLGFSEYMLRLLPFLAGCASLLGFWLFAAGLVDRRSAMLAASILAASFYAVRHGAELKPYAGDMLVSLALTSLSWTVWRHPTSLRLWAALAAAAATAVWLSFPAAFVAAGAGVLLTARVRRLRSARAVAGLGACTAAVAASFIAMFAVYAGPHAVASPWSRSYWGAAFPPIQRPWRLPLWLLDAHTGNMLAYPLGGNHGGSTVTFLLVAAGAVTLWRRRQRVLLWLLLGPLAATFVAAAMQWYPYGFSARTMLFMAPAFCLLAGLGLAEALKRLLPRRSVAGGFRAAAIVLALIVAGGLLRDVVRPYKTVSDQEVRQAVRDLADQVRPGDAWVVFNAIREVPHAPDLRQAVGYGARFRFYVQALAPVPLDWSPPPRAAQPPADGRVWLLIYRHHRPDPREGLLADYVETLAERLGRPQRQGFRLSSPEKAFPRSGAIEAYCFPSRK